MRIKNRMLMGQAMFKSSTLSQIPFVENEEVAFFIL